MVTAQVLEHEVERFFQKTIECALATRKEAGNIRYDILQNEADPSCFVIYEVYRSREDFMFHRETDHSVKWKVETESSLAKPRERIRCNAVYFSE
jgi:quinol monooxygenase YgiN